MDEMLFRRARDGDPEAFEALMAAMEPLVWRVCWHYTGNREDASDCGQETMIKIWRSLAQYRGDCAFETWVYRIAASCSLDFLRKRKRERAESIEPLREQGFDPPDENPGTEERVITADRQARIREAIAALPEEQRDALVLTQLEGKSYEETSDLLGISEGTVKSRVTRARKRLQQWFSQSEELSVASGVQQNISRERRRRQ